MTAPTAPSPSPSGNASATQPPPAPTKSSAAQPEPEVSRAESRDFWGEPSSSASGKLAVGWGGMSGVTYAGYALTGSGPLLAAAIGSGVVGAAAGSMWLGAKIRAAKEQGNGARNSTSWGGREYRYNGESRFWRLLHPVTEQEEHRQRTWNNGADTVPAPSESSADTVSAQCRHGHRVNPNEKVNCSCGGHHQATCGMRMGDKACGDVVLMPPRGEKCTETGGRRDRRAS